MNGGHFFTFTVIWTFLFCIAVLAIGFSGYAVLWPSSGAGLGNTLFVWLILLINPITVRLGMFLFSRKGKD